MLCFFFIEDKSKIDYFKDIDRDEVRTPCVRKLYAERKKNNNRENCVVENMKKDDVIVLTQEEIESLKEYCYGEFWTLKLFDDVEDLDKYVLSEEIESVSENQQVNYAVELIKKAMTGDFDISDLSIYQERTYCFQVDDKIVHAYCNGDDLMSIIRELKEKENGNDFYWLNKHNQIKKEIVEIKKMMEGVKTPRDAFDLAQKLGTFLEINGHPIYNESDLEKFHSSMENVEFYRLEEYHSLQYIYAFMDKDKKNFELHCDVYLDSHKEDLFLDSVSEKDFDRAFKREMKYRESNRRKTLDERINKAKRRTEKIKNISHTNKDVAR